MGSCSSESASSAAIFIGEGGSADLSILGYQFPGAAAGSEDAGWLVIGARAVLGGSEWQFQDPCLTVTEVLRLADWLETLAQGRAAPNYCGFTEPNLQFDHVPGRGIRLSFALESAPPWAKRGGDWGTHGFDIPIGPQLAIAAAQLRDRISRLLKPGGSA